MTIEKICNIFPSHISKFHKISLLENFSLVRLPVLNIMINMFALHHM